MGFADIIGQDKPLAALRAAFANGRLHHAYLFFGPEGVGKHTVAVAFAKAIHCSELTGDFCGRCINCKRIADSNHPDVRVIEPLSGKKEISIAADSRARARAQLSVVYRQTQGRDHRSGHADEFIVAKRAFENSRGAARGLLDHSDCAQCRAGSCRLCVRVVCGSPLRPWRAKRSPPISVTRTA